MNCPFCKSTVAEGAVVCAQCTRYVQGKECTACVEYVPQEASVCRYCSYNFAPTTQMVDVEAFTIQADMLGTVLLNGRLLTQHVEVTPEKIVVTTPGYLGLSKSEEEIPWSKIAGYNYHSGLIWDAIVIETRGQTANRIRPLAKADAQRIREVLQQVTGL